MKPTPKVSVIVPNFNHARYLPERINTILNQTFQDFEIIYLDDASTDNSPEAFAPYASDPHISAAVTNEKNTGTPFAQWNRGVALARGEYVWIAEADDYSDATFLEKIIRVLSSLPEVGIAYCRSKIVDENGQLIRLVEYPDFGEAKNIWESDYVHDGSSEALYRFAFYNIFMNASSVVFRRSLYEQIGGADDSYYTSGDYLAWLKMLPLTKVAYIAEPLNYWRMHDSNVRASIDSGRMETYLQETFRILEYIGSLPGMTPKVFERCCYDRTSYWFTATMMGGIKTLSSHKRIFSLARKVDNRLFRHLYTTIVERAKIRVARFTRGLFTPAKQHLPVYGTYQSGE